MSVECMLSVVLPMSVCALNATTAVSAMNYVIGVWKRLLCDFNVAYVSIALTSVGRWL